MKHYNKNKRKKMKKTTYLFDVHKKTLLSFINFYKHLLKSGKIKENGSAHNRLKELILRHKGGQR